MAGFYKVFDNSGRDLTDFVVSFSYEEAQDKADMLSIRIRDNTEGFSIISDKELQKGKQIVFVFGEVGGITSGRRAAKIANKSRKYSAAGVVFDIQAMDEGYLMKKVEKNTVWKDKTISDIVESIAFANNLNPQVEKTAQRYECIPQANMTDHDFIKKLANMEKDGSYRYYIRGGELFFDKLDLKKEPERLFEFGGNGNIISFDISEDGALQPGAAKDAVVMSYDPLTGKAHKKKAGEGTAKDDIKLDDFTVLVDSFGSMLATTPAKALKTGQTGAGKVFPVVADSEAETENIASKIKKDAALEGYKAALTVSLDAALRPDTIITIRGVSSSDEGNYYVLAVRHSLNPGSPAVSVMELRKNASKKPQYDGQGANETSKTNKKTAESEKKDGKLFYFDQNGEIVK